MIPRKKPDGDHNDYRFRRLKDKLGTRTVPTGEVAFEGTKAYLVGDADRGFEYMTDMLNRSRLSVAMQGLGIAGRALLAYRIHAADREVFGERLVDKPLMQRDLVAMTTRHEAEIALGLEACRTFDRWARESPSNAEETFRRMRLLVPLVKYRAARHGLETASYATEVLGGNGVVREFPTHRLAAGHQ